MCPADRRFHRLECLLFLTGLTEEEGAQPEESDQDRFVMSMLCVFQRIVEHFDSFFHKLLGVRRNEWWAPSKPHRLRLNWNSVHQTIAATGP